MARISQLELDMKTFIKKWMAERQKLTEQIQSRKLDGLGADPNLEGMEAGISSMLFEVVDILL